MDGEPDEEVVEPAEDVPAGAKVEKICEGGGDGEGGEGDEAVVLPGAVGEGCEEDHEDVDDEEPGGQEGELGGVFENDGWGVEPFGPRAEYSRQVSSDQDPGGEDGEDGEDQALEAAGEPGGVVFAAALGGLPAESVDVAADEEEDGHDLEEPGEPAYPRGDGAYVLDGQVVAFGMDGDDKPVAEDDEADGDGAQEVDVAVALGRCLGGLVGGAGPDGHGQWSVVGGRWSVVSGQ